MGYDFFAETDDQRKERELRAENEKRRGNSSGRYKPGRSFIDDARDAKAKVRRDEQPDEKPKDKAKLDKDFAEEQELLASGYNPYKLSYTARSTLENPEKSSPQNLDNARAEQAAKSLRMDQDAIMDNSVTGGYRIEREGDKGSPAFVSGSNTKDPYQTLADGTRGRVLTRAQFMANKKAAASTASAASAASSAASSVAQQNLKDQDQTLYGDTKKFNALPLNETFGKSVANLKALSSNGTAVNKDGTTAYNKNYSESIGGLKDTALNSIQIGLRDGAGLDYGDKNSKRIMDNSLSALGLRTKDERADWGTTSAGGKRGERDPSAWKDDFAKLQRSQNAAEILSGFKSKGIKLTEQQQTGITNNLLDGSTEKGGKKVSGEQYAEQYKAQLANAGVVQGGARGSSQQQQQQQSQQPVASQQKRQDPEQRKVVGQFDFLSAELQKLASTMANLQIQMTVFNESAGKASQKLNDLGGGAAPTTK